MLPNSSCLHSPVTLQWRHHPRKHPHKPRTHSGNWAPTNNEAELNLGPPTNNRAELNLGAADKWFVMPLLPRITVKGPEVCPRCVPTQQHAQTLGHEACLVFAS